MTRIILFYAVCVVGGILAGLIASAMIVRSATGPNCCAPGDGILWMLCAIVLVPLGVALRILLGSTDLRVRRDAQKTASDPGRFAAFTDPNEWSPTRPLLAIRRDCHGLESGLGKSRR